MDGHDADNSKQSTSDMTAFCAKPSPANAKQVSDNVGFYHWMGNRIDELEQSINDLRAEMGQEGSPSPSTALKTKDEPKSSQDS
ncbi:hypothetical protein CASFOL_012795 [Castilleja foliolosa]|uniref:Uncharacterized protein n=1 Tax=Castilleja foliolosa TaxID=1961234 RepID=A0ABD3DM74_9LAMI